MQESAFSEAVQHICRTDSRFHPEAYFFIREVLDFTVEDLEKPRTGAKRHVSGKELLDGFRKYALREFGPMSKTVLATWGIKSTANVGSIVFNLVEAGKLGKAKEDSPDDFNDVYDFDEAFAKPFRPKRGQTTTFPSAKRARNTESKNNDTNTGKKRKYE